LVAVCVVGFVTVVVVVGVLTVVVGVETVVDGVLVEFVVLLVVLEQSRAASSLTVAAPWPRLLTSV
jgi:hypothetical protein